MVFFIIHPSPAEVFAFWHNDSNLGGGIAIGLYHRLGRRKHWRRTRELRDGKDRDFQPPLPTLGVTDENNAKTLASWHLDMYFHPFETGHLLVEITDWFKENNLIMTGTAPAFRWGANFWSGRPFFEKTPISKWHRNKITCLFKDLLLWARSVENGYFLIFGRKE